MCEVPAKSMVQPPLLAKSKVLKSTEVMGSEFDDPTMELEASPENLMGSEFDDPTMELEASPENYEGSGFAFLTRGKVWLLIGVFAIFLIGLPFFSVLYEMIWAVKNNPLTQWLGGEAMALANMMKKCREGEEKGEKATERYTGFKKFMYCTLFLKGVGAAIVVTLVAKALRLVGLGGLIDLPSAGAQAVATKIAQRQGISRTKVLARIKRTMQQKIKARERRSGKPATRALVKEIAREEIKQENENTRKLEKASRARVALKVNGTPSSVGLNTAKAFNAKVRAAATQKRKAPQTRKGKVIKPVKIRPRMRGR